MPSRAGLNSDTNLNRSAPDVSIMSQSSRVGLNLYFIIQGRWVLQLKIMVISFGAQDYRVLIYVWSLNLPKER